MKSWNSCVLVLVLVLFFFFLSLLKKENICWSNVWFNIMGGFDSWHFNLIIFQQFSQHSGILIANCYSNFKKCTVPIVHNDQALWNWLDIVLVNEIQINRRSNWPTSAIPHHRKRQIKSWHKVCGDREFMQDIKNRPLYQHTEFNRHVIAHNSSKRHLGKKESCKPGGEGNSIIESAAI